MSTRTILLLDDDTPFRGRLAQALRRRGLAVLEAGTVQEARALLDQHRPDDAVVDLRMPGPSGLTAIPLLRAHHPDMRIVVLTGYGSIPAAIEAVRAGALDLLLKPVDADDILAALEGTHRVAGNAPEDVPTLEQVEWDHIHRVLVQVNHNISAAARLLGIDRRSLQRKLAKYSPH